MKLATVDITNFRCFESLSIPLHPDVNVLVGANGAGKTALLDAIALSFCNVVYPQYKANSPFTGPLDKTLRPSDIHVALGSDRDETGRKDFVHLHTVVTDCYKCSDTQTGEDDPPQTRATDNKPSEKKKGLLKFMRQCVTSPATLLSPMVDGISKVEPLTFAWDEQITYAPPNSFEHHLEGFEPLQKYLEGLWKALRNTPKAEIPFPVFGYYPASRRLAGMPEMGDIFKPISLGLSLEIARTTPYQAMCRWFYLRENQELRAKQYPYSNGESDFSDLKAVRHALITMLENVENVFFDGNPPMLKVAWTNCSNTPKIVSLEQLSDGYRNLLAVVLDFARQLAQAHPQWENPLEAPGILLIDEIDLHLHPKWQQRIIPNLRKVFPNTQIIVTTHSPQILTTVRREHILLLGSDRQFESIPDDVGTYGAENSRVLAEIFGTPARPQDIETVRDLRTYLGLVEAGQHETEEAKTLKERLETAIGKSDPDLFRADLRIKQLKILRAQ